MSRSPDDDPISREKREFRLLVSALFATLIFCVASAVICLNQYEMSGDELYLWIGIANVVFAILNASNLGLLVTVFFDD